MCYNEIIGNYEKANHKPVEVWSQNQLSLGTSGSDSTRLRANFSLLIPTGIPTLGN
ncbi:MAG: hypothetical protein WC553_01060 [Patescibacteria group bacterium]|jgi:hypothetical protein